jgi:hypothetical protein
MRRLAIYLLVLSLIPLAVAMPYGTSRLINLAYGPWATHQRHPDGSVSHMVFDPNIKPPAWLHFPPGTIVADAGTTASNTTPDVYGNFDVVVPLKLADAQRYFTESLTAEGFVMTDLGLGTLTRQEAEYLGEAGTMTGMRASTGESITIAFREEEEGVFRKGWQVQLGWHRGARPVAAK